MLLPPSMGRAAPHTGSPLVEASSCVKSDHPEAVLLGEPRLATGRDVLSSQPPRLHPPAEAQMHE